MPRCVSAAGRLGCGGGNTLMKEVVCRCIVIFCDMISPARPGIFLPV
ncbi:hypothetical protein HMPREF0758_4881 [Serratia odorifera DSM 4582]|uniref:Uncharacterized protein n=1 Tax=Serratia odorifera DSM 4582 TaxID=667129 RepID=D4E9N1_SEROD|nr:hypothetical protein HMPREF0758_4881 [Serratia odorifera DSM 4582]